MVDRTQLQFPASMPAISSNNKHHTLFS